MLAFNNFPKKVQALKILTILGISVGFSLVGCSSLTGNSSANSSQTAVAWLNSGALTFSGPVPQAQTSNQSASTRTANYNDFAYGFSPTAPSGKRSLILDTEHKSAKLMQAGKELASAKLLDTTGLVAGSYKVAHKQRNPLWYAPQNYFSARGINVPAEGDKKRYLRGAFGDFALFVSPTEAIHSGPFSLSELTGARLEEQDFAKIFYLVEVGDSITVE